MLRNKIAAVVALVLGLTFMAVSPASAVSKGWLDCQPCNPSGYYVPFSGSTTYHTGSIGGQPRVGVDQESLTILETGHNVDYAFAVYDDNGVLATSGAQTCSAPCAQQGNSKTYGFSVATYTSLHPMSKICFGVNGDGLGMKCHWTALY